MPRNEIGVFLTYSELIGHTVSEKDFIALLSEFSQQSVIKLCSFLSLLLGISKRGSQTDNIQAALLYDLFPPHVAVRIAGKLWAVPEERRTLIHRRQMLLIAEFAVRYCPSNGISAMESQQFGSVLLIANDLIDYPVEGMSNPIVTRSDIASYISMMLSAGEYGHRFPSQAMARPRRLLIDIPAKLFPELDLNSHFQAISKISLETYFGLSIAATSKFYRYSGEEWLSHANEGVLVAAELLSEGIAPKQVNDFLNLISASTGKLKSLGVSAERRRNDTTMFRKFPFIEMPNNVGLISQVNVFVPIDLEFMLDKLLSGPFWLLRASIREFDSRYWGKVFEAYVCDILERSCKDTHQKFMYQPRYRGSADEVTDALVIDNESIVLIEIKTCMMDVGSKYGGNADSMEQQLEKLLVGTDQKPKAALQLRNAVQQLFNKEAPRLIENLDISSIKECFCLVVTLDYIGGAPGVATFVNDAFLENLTIKDLSVSVEGAFSVNVEEVERMTGYFDTESMAALLQKWKALNPTLGTPFSMLEHDLSWGPPDWLEEDYRHIFNRALEHLMPNEYVKQELYKRSNQPHLDRTKRR